MGRMDGAPPQEWFATEAYGPYHDAPWCVRVHAQARALPTVSIRAGFFRLLCQIMKFGHYCSLRIGPLHA